MDGEEEDWEDVDDGIGLRGTGEEEEDEIDGEDLITLETEEEDCLAGVVGEEEEEDGGDSEVAVALDRLFDEEAAEEAYC